MLSQTHLKVVHGLAVFLYALFLIAALWTAYFAYVAISGGPGTPPVDVLEATLRKLESSSLGAVGELLAAVPAIALGLAANADGTITSRGKMYMYLLVPTFFVAFFVSFFFDPLTADLGATGTPQLVAATAGRLSNFALTYIIAVLGLRKIMAAAETVK